mgnify:CR=1 FL=1
MDGLPLKEVLQVFSQPTRAATAAQRFGCSERIVVGLLTQLQARGLVTPAEPGVGECKSGCGMCSMQNFCPSSEAENPPSPLEVKTDVVWRLTQLGQSVS